MFVLAVVADVKEVVAIVKDADARQDLACFCHCDSCHGSIGTQAASRSVSYIGRSTISADQGRALRVDSQPHQTSWIAHGLVTAWLSYQNQNSARHPLPRTRHPGSRAHR